MGRSLLGLFVLLVAGAALVAGAGYWGYARLQVPGPLAVETTVLVPRGESLTAIGERLHAAGVVENATLFRLGARLLSEGRPLKAGEYAFAARASALEVMNQMIEGRTLARRLTVAEGLTVSAVLALVSAAEGLVGDPPADAAGLAEGSLLPETYFFAWGDGRAEMIERMAAAMRAAVDELWPVRAPGLPLDSPAGALILASIVEKETGVAAERPRIARVFINRLEKGMPLQSDPTVIFALTQGKMELGRQLTQADLTVDSPYNTYQHAGLPPGPIANPGRAALEAVLHPSAGKDLYFVADGSGGHAFATTLAEHSRNVAKWRKLNQ